MLTPLNILVLFRLNLGAFGVTDMSTLPIL